MVARTAKTSNTVKPTIIDMPDAPETEFSFRDFAASMGFEMPSGRLLLAGLAVQVVVGFVTGYAATQLVSYVMVGALLLSGSAFLALLAAVITAVITAYLSIVAVSRSGAYITSGKLEEHAVAAKNWITGLFKNNSKKEAAHA